MQLLSHKHPHKKRLDPGSASNDDYLTPLLSRTMSSDDKHTKSDPVVVVTAVDPEATSIGQSSVDGASQGHKRQPWWSYIWASSFTLDHEPNRTPEEHKFVQKLDSFLLTILCLGYFIKTLDQNNIANAYVSGMKEDLDMNANQLNLIDVAWSTGYVLGQIPSQVILTKVRPSIWIPSCELAWVTLTFCLAAATSSNHVIVIRFFVGLMEGVYYPAAHFLLGSWYKPSELGKRACVFQASSAVAGICSGYLQAAVFKGLDGTAGKAGWQWLFIMDAVISLPVCLVGFFFIPDLPENTRAFYLKSKDAVLARRRMDDIGRAPRRKLGWTILRRLFSRWHVYALSVLYLHFIIVFPSNSINPFALWLKANNWPITMINIIPTGQSAIQLITTILFAILSDFLRSRALVMAISIFFGFFSSLLLAIWSIPIGLKWYAFFSNRISIAFGPLSMTWANELCSTDAEERALVLGMMNCVAFVFNAWVPLFTYPAKTAPRFKTGFIFSTCGYGVLLGLTGLVAWLQRRDQRKSEKKVLDEVGRVEGMFPTNEV